MTEDEFEELVELWHTGGSGLPLHEFLGMTREEFARMVTSPSEYFTNAPNPASPKTSGA